MAASVRHTSKMATSGLALEPRQGENGRLRQQLEALHKGLVESEERMILAHRGTGPYLRAEVTRLTQDMNVC